MNVLERAKVLADAGRYDSCGPKGCEVKVLAGLGGIYHAKAEHKTCRLFKTLMDNNCSLDCKYCQNASGCDNKKASYTPEELATLFNYLHKHFRVDGLFLSSSVAGDPDEVTERMIEAVCIIRQKYGFNGYVHFKVLPGTSYELIKRAAELATRLSINIEAPNETILEELSSCKDYKTDILRRQEWISELNLPGGQTTQVIVNDMATDEEILRMLDREYKKFDLRRVYFSAFKPIKGTPLENEKPCPLHRQNLLYKVDFLKRVYGYKIEEFKLIMEGGMLPYEDPKLALAKATFDSPIDINEASYEELVRIPGIGPKAARKIVESKGKITSYKELKGLGVWVKRAKPFIEVNGKKQTMLKGALMN